MTGESGRVAAGTPGSFVIGDDRQRRDQTQRLGDVSLRCALAALGHDKTVGNLDAPMGRDKRRDSTLDGFECLQGVRSLLVFQDKAERGGTVDDESFHALNPATGVDEVAGRLALAEQEA